MKIRPLLKNYKIIKKLGYSTLAKDYLVKGIKSRILIIIESIIIVIPIIILSIIVVIGEWANDLIKLEWGFSYSKKIIKQYDDLHMKALNIIRKAKKSS